MNIKYDILLIVKELSFHNKKCRNCILFKSKCTMPTLYFKFWL